MVVVILPSGLFLETETLAESKNAEKLRNYDPYISFFRSMVKLVVISDKWKDSKSFLTDVEHKLNLWSLMVSFCIYPCYFSMQLEYVVVSKTKLCIRQWKQMQEMHDSAMIFDIKFYNSYKNIVSVKKSQKIWIRIGDYLAI